jgi:hypothetical protein
MSGLGELGEGAIDGEGGGVMAGGVMVERLPQPFKSHKQVIPAIANLGN